ncbi:MAG: hypothetical protein ACE5HO_16435 [bacterium]
MEGNAERQQSQERQTDSDSADRLPFVDLISVQSVVNILVKKGICTFDEIFEEERKHKKHKASVRNLAVVPTEGKVQNRTSAATRNGRTHKHQMSWFKRKMSKRRLTRKLGSALFGWEWKKVKRSGHEKNPDGNAVKYRA